EGQALGKIRGSRGIQRFQLGTEILDHAFCNRIAGGTASELIGRGEKKSFEAASVRGQIGNQRGVFCGVKKTFAGADSLAIEFRGHFKYVPTFGNRYGADVDLASGNLPKEF